MATHDACIVLCLSFCWKLYEIFLADAKYANSGIFSTLDVFSETTKKACYDENLSTAYNTSI